MWEVIQVMKAFLILLFLIVDALNSKLPFCEIEQMEKHFSKCISSSRLVTFVAKKGEKCKPLKPMMTTCLDSISNDLKSLYLILRIIRF
jgi:hypothetical protein